MLELGVKLLSIYNPRTSVQAANTKNSQQKSGNSVRFGAGVMRCERCLVCVNPVVVHKNVVGSSFHMVPGLWATCPSFFSKLSDPYLVPRSTPKIKCPKTTYLESDPCLHS